jgi:hypothetical protein
VADGDQNIKHMPIGNRGQTADEEDEMRGAENEYIHLDDLREEEDDDDEEEDDDSSEGDDDTSGDSSSNDDDDEIDNEIVERFILTFHNGDYDTEFDDKLSFDRSIIPPARPTQASYNKPNNWRERNRIGLEKMKEKLQTIIHKVPLGHSFKLDLTYNSYGHQLMDNDEPIVWHEPFSIVNDYWDKLKEAIDRKKHATEIRGIQFANVEMTKERLAALVSILSSRGATNSIKYAHFDNANLCEKGIVWLAKLLDISLELQYFSIHHNRINNMDLARCLTRSLRSHTCINDLRLTHCDLGSSPEILSVILQADVKYINLDSNNIDSLGAIKIAEYLEVDPPIEMMSLGHNRLNDDAVTLISQALKSNTNLEMTCLHSNNFTSIGVKALITSVFDSSSLNAISESNHTLRRLWIFLDQKEPIMLYLNRVQKIVLALNDKDTLPQYLANVPVELIPEVLAFPLCLIVHEHQHKHLNIVYSTMRWWNMPMLYSYHHCVKFDTKRKRDASL